MNNDFFKFFPDAWLGDEKLALCRFATKGAWIDLLCHMHKCDPYGYLIINGVVLSDEDIFKMLKFDNPKHFEVIWSELLKFGIIKKDGSSGAYYSKRLLEEYDKNFSLSDKPLPHIPKAMRILEYFNDIVKEFPKVDPSNKYLQTILHDWFEKYEEEDFHRVTCFLYDKWKDSEVMNKHIVPTTFFGQKFPKYVAESSAFKLENKKKVNKNFKGSIGYDQYK